MFKGSSLIEHDVMTVYGRLPYGQAFEASFLKESHT